MPPFRLRHLGKEGELETFELRVFGDVILHFGLPEYTPALADAGATGKDQLFVQYFGRHEGRPVS